MAPAILDDPTSPPVYRQSGPLPHPLPSSAPFPTILPRHVTLRDRITPATILPLHPATTLIPAALVSHLHTALNSEILAGDTYPMLDPLPLETFTKHWFSNFAAIMLLGHHTHLPDPPATAASFDWTSQCLGSFYIKPNYPGRSSHVSNAGFLVLPPARARGVGRLLGEAYLVYAPQLGYTYSVFNLVYETNLASCRIWDALGFRRIGRVPGCGELRSYPGERIDAIIYGRALGGDLAAEEAGWAGEDRFERIRAYLKTGRYPEGVGRAEKSRLRSAATHYRLVARAPEDDMRSGGGERLMLKEKEVVSDPQRQYEIAKRIHGELGHGGINKTTAKVADEWHWVRIKETVGLVIRNCGECGTGTGTGKADEAVVEEDQTVGGGGGEPSRMVASSHMDILRTEMMQLPDTTPRLAAEGRAMVGAHTQGDVAAALEHVAETTAHHHVTLESLHHNDDDDNHDDDAYADLPLDPRIMEDVRHHLGHFTDDPVGLHAPLVVHTHHQEMLAQAESQAHSSGAVGHVEHTDYQALLGDGHGLDDDDDGGGLHGMAARVTAAARAAQVVMGGMDDGLDDGLYDVHATGHGNGVA